MLECPSKRNQHPRRLAVDLLRYVVLLDGGEQDSISIRVIDHRKVHANGGYKGSVVALIAEASEFAILCIHCGSLFQVELKDDAGAVCYFHSSRGVQKEGQLAFHLDLDVRLPFAS